MIIRWALSSCPVVAVWIDIWFYPLAVLTSLLVYRYGDFTSAISSLDFLKGRGLRAFTSGGRLIGPTKFFSFSQTQFNQLSLDFCLNSVGSCLVHPLFFKRAGGLSMSNFF